LLNDRSQDRRHLQLQNLYFFTCILFLFGSKRFLWPTWNWIQFWNKGTGSLDKRVPCWHARINLDRGRAAAVF
jgi:hypothetical protein